jgi:hypothetical protein
MLQILFHPDCDRPEFIEATTAYECIWADDGERMVETIERISGLKFIERSIHAIVFEGVSHSHPLSLRASYPADVKKSAIAHELCHRLLAAHAIGEHGKLSRPLFRDDVQLHKEMDLILYDIWCDLCGEEFALNQVEHESGLRPLYKHAFDWTLLHTREQREQMFRALPRSTTKPEPS